MGRETIIGYEDYSSKSAAKIRKGNGRDQRKNQRLYQTEAVNKEEKSKRAGCFWKMFCSLACGFLTEVFLDDLFGFVHGLKWFPALILLWFCLSILSCVVLESAVVIWKSGICILKEMKRAGLAGWCLPQAEPSANISGMLYYPRGLKNNCSFSAKACILNAKSRAPQARVV